MASVICFINVVVIVSVATFVAAAIGGLLVKVFTM